MASQKEVVQFEGVITGNRVEATCTVQALKVSLPGTGNVAYAKYTIVHVSEPLPQGIYQLSVNGQVMNVRHAGHGGWVSVGG